MRKTHEVDVSLIGRSDQLLGELELYVTRTAKTHHVQTFIWRQSVPDIGKVFALVL